LFVDLRDNASSSTQQQAAASSSKQQLQTHPFTCPRSRCPKQPPQLSTNLLYLALAAYRSTEDERQ